MSNSKPILFRVLSVLAIIIAVGAAFLRCWNYGIINLDDYSYICGHNPVCVWSGWETLKFAFTDVSEGIWMPITWLSYALDCMIYGDWYGGFHITSILIHMVNACLVWWFLRELFEKRVEAEIPCLIAALVWAVHPLRCESVVFLASRKDVLSFFFEALALICWVRGSRSSKTVLYTASATVLFIIGSFCKPSVMTFPVLCLVLDVLIIRRFDYRRYIAPVAYMLFLGVFAAWQQKANGTIVQMYGDPLWYRVLNAAAAFGIYLRNFVWPQFLAVQCMKMWPAMPRFLWPGLVICALLGWWMVRRVKPYLENWRDILLGGNFLKSQAPDCLFAGAVWFLIAIGPMLGIASFGYHAFADRFTYIPCVGLSIVLVWVMLRVRKSIPVVILFAIMLVGFSWHQTGYWIDDQKLFSHTLEVDGDQNAGAHAVLASWYFEFPHNLEKCVDEFEKGINSNIRYILPIYNVYMIALYELGRYDEISDKMKLFEDTLVRLYGEEGASRVFGLKDGMTTREREMVSVYYSAKVVWWLTDKNCIAEIKDLFKSIPIEAQDDPVWLYLGWRAAKLEGAEKSAVEHLDKLKNNYRREFFFNFRYLRDHKISKSE